MDPCRSIVWEHATFGPQFNIHAWVDCLFSSLVFRALIVVTVLLYLALFIGIIVTFFVDAKDAWTVVWPWTHRLRLFREHAPTGFMGYWMWIGYIVRHEYDTLRRVLWRGIVGLGILLWILLFMLLLFIPAVVLIAPYLPAIIIAIAVGIIIGLFLL